MKKTLIAVAVLALGSTLAVAAPQDGHWSKRDHGRRGMARSEGRLAQKLGLTDAQKDQWKQMREQARTEAAPLRAQIRQNRADLRAARDANDTGRVETLRGTMRSLREQLRAQRKETHDRFLQVLTPDQRAQLQAMKVERKSRHNKQ